MAQFEITKTVEGVKVNKRSGIPTTERVTLSFGAIIVDPREERDYLRFHYLGDPVDVKLSDIRGYYKPLDAASPSTPAAGAPISSRPPASSRAPFLAWESISSTLSVQRAKIPGGWLVAAGNGLAFVPDAAHEWDGSSL